MNELAVRAVSGAVMIAVAIGASVVGGYAFATLVAVLAGLMFVEWLRIVRGWGAVWTIGGFVYVLVPALALLWIRERAPAGLAMLMWVFIVTWSTDIGAYAAGRLIGGPKLAPGISPNKTWAGLIGGMAAAAILGGLWVTNNGLPRLLLALAAPFAFGAQLGDLFESGLKRRAGLKDSGRLLPGHGGALDRLDGLVVVASLTALTLISGTA